VPCDEFGGERYVMYPQINYSQSASQSIDETVNSYGSSSLEQQIVEFVERMNAVFR